MRSCPPYLTCLAGPTEILLRPDSVQIMPAHIILVIRRFPLKDNSPHHDFPHDIFLTWHFSQTPYKLWDSFPYDIFVTIFSLMTSIFQHFSPCTIILIWHYLNMTLLPKTFCQNFIGENVNWGETSCNHLSELTIKSLYNAKQYGQMSLLSLHFTGNISFFERKTQIVPLLMKFSILK